MLHRGLTGQAFSKNIYPSNKIFFIQATLFVKRQVLDYLGDFKIFAAIWNRESCPFGKLSLPPAKRNKPIFCRSNIYETTSDLFESY
jgi:hypothetical protein